jgi:predicted aspartyl protease
LLQTGEGDDRHLPRDFRVWPPHSLSDLPDVRRGQSRKTVQALKALNWAAIGLVLAANAYRTELALRPGGRICQAGHRNVRRRRGAVVKIKKSEGHFIVKAKVNGRRA